MAKILFVHNAATRFVRDDLALLAERHDVTERAENSPRRLRPLDIARAVRSHDLVFAWFASWHSIIPILAARSLGVPSVLVTGGYDTANVPDANYGSQRGGLPMIVSRSAIRAASALIVNSRAARKEAIHNAGAVGGKIHVMYHGVVPISVDSDFASVREPIVLTVGNVWRENFLRKGLLAFVRLAALLPDVKFMHVGKWCDDGIDILRREAGANVEFRGFLPDDELFRLYSRASVYVQASLHEGFGLSVAEAMSGGCIPVTTRKGSLPEVVGECGILSDSTEPGAMVEPVRAAMKANSEMRIAARNRVQNFFTFDARRKALHQLIDSLLTPVRQKFKIKVQEH